MNLEFVKDLDSENVNKIKDRLEWFYSNYEYFKKFNGKACCNKDQKVIDCDKNLDVL